MSITTIDVACWLILMDERPLLYSSNFQKVHFRRPGSIFEYAYNNFKYILLENVLGLIG
jgi:hypothetical protein